MKNSKEEMISTLFTNIAQIEHNIDLIINNDELSDNDIKMKDGFLTIFNLLKSKIEEKEPIKKQSKSK